MDDGGYRNVGNGEVSEFGVLCEFPLSPVPMVSGKGVFCFEKMGLGEGVPRKREG